MAETHAPRQNPPSILLVVAAVFIAIILTIATFIFGTPLSPGTGKPSAPGLQEDPVVPQPINPDEGVACAMDAKICPDGSGVGRVPPTCEFAPCPGN
jgi:hypothetical protein